MFRILGSLGLLMLWMALLNDARLRAQPPGDYTEVETIPSPGTTTEYEPWSVGEFELESPPPISFEHGSEGCQNCGESHGPNGRCVGGKHRRSNWLPSSKWLPRHLHHGQPLRTSSWLNRLFSVGLFGGTLLGDDLVEGQVKQSGDFFGGLRAGWDFDHYWGSEVRFGWSELASSGTHNPPLAATGDVFLADLVFLHYPWGDSRVRPYAMLGIGTAKFDYATRDGTGINEATLAMPVGGGIKYLLRPWLAMRFEVVDHIDFARGSLSTMHNVALTLGLEWRLGGSRRSYYPWHPSRVIR